MHLLKKYIVKKQVYHNIFKREYPQRKFLSKIKIFLIKTDIKKPQGVCASAAIIFAFCKLLSKFLCAVKGGGNGVHNICAECAVFKGVNTGNGGAARAANGVFKSLRVNTAFQSKL